MVVHATMAPEYATVLAHFTDSIALKNLAVLLAIQLEQPIAMIKPEHVFANQDTLELNVRI